MSNENLKIKETFVSAYQSYQKGNLEAAENLYKKILKINPNHFGSIFYLGTLLVQTQKFELAKSLLKKAIQIKPNYADAFNNLGAVLNILGGLRSSCTYVGAPSLKQLSKCTTFIRVNQQYNDTFEQD